MSAPRTFAPGRRRGRHRVPGPVGRIAAGLALAAVVVLAGAALAQAAGVRINTTRSIPVGLYRVSRAPAMPGAYVLVCPPPTPLFDEARARGYLGAGFCPGGYGYLMKRLVAAQGDEIAVSDAGVSVNGVLLALTAPRATDAGGRPLPRWRTGPYRLGAAEVLLMSEISATSFDARYFGPVSRTQVVTALAPILTW